MLGHQDRSITHIAESDRLKFATLAIANSIDGLPTGCRGSVDGPASGRLVAAVTTYERLHSDVSALATARIGATRTLNNRSLLLVVAAGSVMSSISLGVRSTFGVYLDPVVESLQTDRGTYSLAIALQNLFWGLSQPIAGALADRFGTGRVLAIGGVGYAAALLLMSTAQSTGLFLVSAGFLIGVATGAASFSLVLAAVGRMAPPDKAPMALGVVTAMASVGQFVLVPVAQQLLSTVDWRSTVVFMAFVAIAIAALAPVVRGNALQQQGQSSAAAQELAAGSPLRTELRRAAHSRAYVLLNAAFFVCGFHVTFIGTHLVSYSGDVGVSAQAATAGLAIIGLFNIIGSLTAGYLGGRMSKTRVLSTIYAMRAVVITVFLIVPPTGASVIIFGAAIGLLWLATVPLTGGIVNGLFGTTHAGTLFGIVFLSHQLGAFVGAWLGGELADRAGSYAPAWWISVGLGVFAAIVHQFIDESPAPPAPARTTTTGLTPAGGAAVVAVASGTFAIFQPALTTKAEAAAPSGVHESSTTLDPVICALHPVIVE